MTTMHHDLDALLARTVAQLQAMDAADESLATMREPRGISIIKTKPALLPIGRAWRLGVLLLDRLGNLYATGEVTRAIEPQIAVTNRSAEAERKRDLRRAAARGPFPEGEIVNLGFTMLDLGEQALAESDGPVLLDSDVGVLVVLPSGSTMPIDLYLADRVSLFALD